ncbi:MAG TPA: hypothetical protein VFP05_03955 [Thermomicrobiales bacterium]|nr:hypothetical protein [Thermomicrobiales bacterium]
MNRQGSSSVRRWISNLLFVVAAALFIYVAYAYYQERTDDTGSVPTPQSVAGKAELKNVRDAIAAQGATVEYGKDGVRIDGIEPVGQQLKVEGAPVYVFIFESPEDRSEQTADLSADSLQLETPSGADAATGDLAISEGSNILVVSDGATESDQQKIDAGVQSLP